MTEMVDLHTSGCPLCEQTKAYLDSEGISYTLIDDACTVVEVDEHPKGQRGLTWALLLSSPVWIALLAAWRLFL